MKAMAVVFPAENRVEFREIDCPHPGPGDVVVRLAWSWISNGTEGSFLRGERIAGDTARRSGDPYPFPIVPGYQKVGIVEDVGPGVDDVQPGEVVFATVSRVNGMFSPMGGHVSPAVTPRSQIWRLPKDGPPARAYSGLVLTQVGYNCGQRAPLAPGDPAVVIGDGLVGQWAAQTLAWRGGDVVLVGHHDNRLSRFGPRPRRRILNNRTEKDWVALLKAWFPQGVRIVVDTAGDIESVRAMLPLLQRYGHIVSAGFYGVDDLLSVQSLRAREISLDAVSGWSPERMDATLVLVHTGQLQAEPLITHEFPVESVGEAWDLIRSRRDEALGVLLKWS